MEDSTSISTQKIESDKPVKRPPRSKKPNYNVIHADPLPVRITPGSPLLPHNPLNVLYIIFSYALAQWRSRAPTEAPYHGFLSQDSQSVNITDVLSVQELWKKGFFGKGTLSRSEPTWLTRTKRKYGLIEIDEGITAEEMTERRRVERREFKKERAKKEQEKLKKQLVQEGKLPGDADVVDDGFGLEIEKDSRSGPDDNELPPNLDRTKDNHRTDSVGSPELKINEIEHLQLTLEEAFFLSYALGVLAVLEEGSRCPMTVSELFALCCEYSIIPRTVPVKRQQDNPFILSYVAYHHYRSLGWVIKSGTKFTVNFLLYNRGPAFSHAEFAVIVLPSYSHRYWANSDHPTEAWDWMHCVNRVCSQVKKTVLLCYVEIPPPHDTEVESEVSSLLAKYSVREVSVKRWLPSRNRD